MQLSSSGIYWSSVMNLMEASSVELRVLCQGGAGGALACPVWCHFCLVRTHQDTKKNLSPLIGQEFKMTDGKQPSDWTIIQDGGWACDWTIIQDGRQKVAIWLDNNSRWWMGWDWTKIQDGEWNRTGLNKMKFSDWPKFKFKFSLM